jgi:hypothetical protein
MTEEIKQKKREDQKAMWQDPAYRASMAAKSAAKDTKRAGKLISARIKELWQDPAYKEKTLKNRAAIIKKLPRIAKVKAIASANATQAIVAKKEKAAAVVALQKETTKKKKVQAKIVTTQKRVLREVKVAPIDPSEVTPQKAHPTTTSTAEVVSAVAKKKSGRPRKGRPDWASSSDSDFEPKRRGRGSGGPLVGSYVTRRNISNYFAQPGNFRRTKAAASAGAIDAAGAEEAALSTQLTVSPDPEEPVWVSEIRALSEEWEDRSPKRPAFDHFAALGLPPPAQASPAPRVQDMRLIEEVDSAGRVIARYTLQEYKDLYAKLVREEELKRARDEAALVPVVEEVEEQDTPEVEEEVPAQANRGVQEMGSYEDEDEEDDQFFVEAREWDLEEDPL